jgi:hypothetical protein
MRGSKRYIFAVLFAVCYSLFISPTGALAQLNPDVDRDTTKWFNRTQRLAGVDVEAHRSRYSRKNNPAVEMMRKVIAAKRYTDLSRRDYYQYSRYQKLTLAVNDITPSHFENPMFKGKQWLVNQVEFCPYNNKLILPVSLQETVSEEIYRREPRDRRTIVRGINQEGVSDLFQTGDILTTLLSDVFSDVNIYDDQIRLLRHYFTSPIGDGAISFYRYYIEDTIYVDRDLCFHLSFLPNNQQDFGFRGDLYVLADSSWQVRRCQMTIPPQSDVNFVNGMRLWQDFSRLDDGSWVLTADELFTELRWASFMESFAVVRSTRLSDFSFNPLPQRLFKGSKREMRDANAMMRNDDFWAQYRQVELTKSESSMDRFIKGMQQTKGFGAIIFCLKALIENFVETGSKQHPSKVDIGPVNTMITGNYVDGLRTRLSAQTTANLDSNLFLSGYVAHGWRSKKNYYRGDIIWSFNKKEYLPREYPKRTLTLTSTYDVMSPCDRFLDTDKDNVFAAFKWASVEQMMFYNRQQLAFEYETYGGVKTTLSLKTEHDAPAGDIDFLPFRTTELHAELRFAPGETFINTKQRRMPVSLDAPVFTLGHTIGISGLLGGDHTFHLTEATAYKRFWLGHGWGKLECRLKAAAQWNQVPGLLLIMPEANLSYIMSDNMFELVNNMEFLTDRYASAMINWDLSGKLFNRIPLLRRLKWREWLSVRCMWGDLTSKNAASLLGLSPDGDFTFGTLDPHHPYWEVSAGIHNIFKLLHVEYVRRLNYLYLPTAHKQGIRLMLRMRF